MAASESYPDELLYHSEHDWARIDGDEAVLGVTWFAQDALGELVHYEPPDVGSTVGEGRVVRRGRVGQGRLGSDLAALGRGARGEPEGRRRARDGERGSVRRRLADPHPHVEPGRARPAALGRRLPQGPRRRVSYLSLTDADREAMLAAIGVASVDELFRDIPAGRALRHASSTCRRRCRRRSSSGTSRSSPAKNVVDEVCFLGAGIYDHYVPAVVDAVLQRGELLTAYTPYQPEMSQGVLQAIFEYQTAICELTGMDVSNASGYDGTTVAADACFVAKHATGRVEDRRHRGDEPAGAPGREDVRAGLRARDRRGAARGRCDRPGPGPRGGGGRGGGHLPAAELLRLLEAAPELAAAANDAGRDADRARRPRVARRARGAGRLRLRDGDRRGPVGRQRDELRRPALRLPRRALRLHPPAAGPDRRRDGGRRGRARLCADPADARAAHPAREGDVEHHHQPDPARAGRARAPEPARPAGAARAGGDLHGARPACEGGAAEGGARAGVSRAGNVQGVCSAHRTERARGARATRGARASTPATRSAATTRASTTRCSSPSPRSGRSTRSTGSWRRSHEADLREVAGRAAAGSACRSREGSTCPRCRPSSGARSRRACPSSPSRRCCATSRSSRRATSGSTPASTRSAAAR